MEWNIKNNKRCTARLETPGCRVYKAQHEGGGATINSSNKSTPTWSSELSGILYFVKIHEFYYALLPHKSSEYLIVLGRLIESLFSYRWEEKIAGREKRILSGSTRSVFIERLAENLIRLSDLCEPSRVRIILPEHVLIMILDGVEETSRQWLEDGAFPQEVMITFESDFSMTISATLFKSVANC